MQDEDEAVTYEDLSNQPVQSTDLHVNDPDCYIRDDDSDVAFRKDTLVRFKKIMCPSGWNRFQKQY